MSYDLTVQYDEDFSESARLGEVMDWLLAQPGVSSNGTDSFVLDLPEKKLWMEMDVAVWTDLDNVGKEEVVAPVVKVLRYPLKTVLGQPLEWGLAVPTASSYSGSEKAEAWTDFEPLFLEEGCGDAVALHEVLARIPAWQWAELDGAVQRLSAEGRLRPGLWRVG